MRCHLDGWRDSQEEWGDHSHTSTQLLPILIWSQRTWHRLALKINTQDASCKSSNELVYSEDVCHGIFVYQFVLYMYNEILALASR